MFARRFLKKQEPGSFNGRRTTSDRYVAVFFSTFTPNAKHMDFLLEKGRMYLVTNQSILFHGCMPVDEHGEFLSFKLGSETYQGKQLMAFF